MATCQAFLSLAAPCRSALLVTSTSLTLTSLKTRRWAAWYGAQCMPRLRCCWQDWVSTIRMLSTAAEMESSHPNLGPAKRDTHVTQHKLRALSGMRGCPESRGRGGSRQPWCVHVRSRVPVWGAFNSVGSNGHAALPIEAGSPLRQVTGAISVPGPEITGLCISPDQRPKAFCILLAQKTA